MRCVAGFVDCLVHELVSFGLRDSQILFQLLLEILVLFSYFILALLYFEHYFERI